MKQTESILRNPPGFKKLSLFQQNKKHPQFCIGIDPPIDPREEFFSQNLKEYGAFKFLRNYTHALLETCFSVASSAKFQSAFFEAFGIDGIRALQETIAYAKKNSLFTILDAKRGDISSTMQAYGKSCFEFFDADAMTVLAYMGEDSIEALTPWLRQGKTCYMVLVSSNPSGKNLQNIVTKSELFVWEEFFLKIHSFAKKHQIDGQLGFVVGASQCSEVFNRVAVIDPLVDYPWLIPGIGAQGSSFSEIRKSLERNPLNLAPISRGLTQTPKEQPKLKSWDDFKEQIQINLKALLQ